MLASMTVFFSDLHSVCSGRERKDLRVHWERKETWDRREKMYVSCVVFIIIIA